ncbi:hypothetical protein AGMMS49992_06130 [Clostridia bacterium]|nr:hypothetical protein AGMMS49992_06130 [Clostridia bacterium]
MPYPYFNDCQECHDHHDRRPRERRAHGCDILTPLASGTLRTRGDWVAIELPRHISGRRPLKLTTVAAEGVESAVLDPACAGCQSEYGLAIRVTIPLSLTLVDSNGYQHAICSAIDVCVPITQAACPRIPRNAHVRVKACVSLAEPVCIDDCDRFIEALLDMRIDAYVVGKLPKPHCDEPCALPLPWYPQPPRCDRHGRWFYNDERYD